MPFVPAIKVTSGKLLWRRYVGFAADLPPLSVDNQVLVFDAKFKELLSLDEQTGKLRWRQDIGESIAAPLVVDGKAFLAAESGKLFVLDLASGNRLGFLKFAQPLRVTPIVDHAKKHLLLTGDHSSIYTVALADLKSTGVFYLGHSSGSINVPLVPSGAFASDAGVKIGPSRNALTPSTASARNAGVKSIRSSTATPWRSYGGGFVGNGCVGEVHSPSTSVCGTGRSSIGQTGSPVTRSNV